MLEDANSQKESFSVWRSTVCETCHWFQKQWWRIASKKLCQARTWEKLHRSTHFGKRASKTVGQIYGLYKQGLPKWQQTRQREEWESPAETLSMHFCLGSSLWLLYLSIFAEDTGRWWKRRGLIPLSKVPQRNWSLRSVKSLFILQEEEDMKHVIEELVSESEVQDFLDIKVTSLLDQFVVEGLPELIEMAGSK